MKDTKPPENEQPRLAENCSETESRRRGDATLDAFHLVTADLFHTSARTYDATMLEELSKIELDEECIAALDRGIAKGCFSSREAAQALLLQPLAQDTLTVLWKFGPFLEEESFCLAGQSRPFSALDQSLNKNQLINYVCDDLGLSTRAEVRRVETSVGRYLSAMEAFGLVKITNVRTNLLSIKVRPPLNQILRRSIAAVAEIYSSQIGEDEQPHV